MLIKKEDRMDNKVVNLHIKAGAFVLSHAPQGEEIEAITGSVLGILWKTHRDKDRNSFFLWHLRMRDMKTGESYDISFPYTSQAARTLICSLSTCESFEDIKIKAYCSKNGSRTTKISVYEDDMRVDYPAGLIPGKEHPKERQMALHELANEVNDRIEDEKDIKEEKAEFYRQQSGYAPNDPFEKFMSEYNELRIEARDRGYEKRNIRYR